MSDLTEKPQGQDRPARASDDGRRHRILDAAIGLLAGEGARGLTHRAIDRLSGFPEGSTSNFFRSRHDILVATCHRLVDLDLADLSSLQATAEPAQNLAGELTRVAAMLIDLMALPKLARSRARIELYLAATRNAELFRVFALRWQPAILDYTERGILRFAPDAPPKAFEIYRAMLTGLLMRSAFIPGSCQDPFQLEQMLLALIPNFLPADLRSGAPSSPATWTSS